LTAVEEEYEVEKMKKATFLEYDKPRLCAMVQDSTPADMINTISGEL
jgi:hypothetical protein